MPKPIKWSSLADADLAKLLDYLEYNWNNKICLDFIENLDHCISLLQKNPDLFPFVNLEINVRRCVVTNHNSIFYRETNSRIEILRLYDTRQNPENLIFL